MFTCSDLRPAWIHLNSALDVQELMMSQPDPSGPESGGQELNSAEVFKKPPCGPPPWEISSPGPRAAGVDPLRLFSLAAS